MQAFKVVGTNPYDTGEKGWRYLVSKSERAILGRDAEFVPVEVDPAEFLESKATRSTAFNGWILEHQWKADGQLYH